MNNQQEKLLRGQKRTSLLYRNTFSIMSGVGIALALFSLKRSSAQELLIISYSIQ